MFLFVRKRRLERLENAKNLSKSATVVVGIQSKVNDLVFTLPDFVQR